MERETFADMNFYISLYPLHMLMIVNSKMSKNIIFREFRQPDTGKLGIRNFYGFLYFADINEFMSLRCATQV